MKSDTIYESHISTTKWLVYDVPGNVGWIMYLVCLIQCFVKRPEYMEVPLVLISLVIGILPAIAMAVGIVELISERILKPDQILPKERLYRGLCRLHFDLCLFGSTVPGVSGMDSCRSDNG